MRLAIDSETTGLDMHHGCRPFFVTMCFDDWTQAHWEWDVDPLTRRVHAVRDDLLEIIDLINQADLVIGQNIKFDVAMILALFRDHGITFEWPWHKTRDTLIAGHTLHSAQPHDLTSMTVLATGRSDIKPLEDALNNETNRARRVVQQAQRRVKVDAERKASSDTTAQRDDRFVLPNVSQMKSGMGAARPGFSWRDRAEASASAPATFRRKASASAKKKVRDEIDAAARTLSGWRISREGDPITPSAGGEGSWRGDTWLPRQLAKYRWEVLRDPAYNPDLAGDDLHMWWTVLHAYGNADSGATMALWQVQEGDLLRRKIMPHFLVRMESSRLAFLMEDVGVTVNHDRFNKQYLEYQEESRDAGTVCVNIAESLGYDLKLPKNGNNASLTTFCFGPPAGDNGNGRDDARTRQTSPTCLNLPAVKRSAKTGAPSLDAAAMDHYIISLPENSKERLFIKSLRAKRKRDKAVENLDTYRRFWIPMCIFNDAGEQLWYRLHPSLNPTGTSTLRWSSNNPNEQNISKKEGFNLRESFGPDPGYEWWAFDAENIELRIPAYEAGEEEKIALFERPHAPPFYGSDHILNFSIVYPDVWAKAVAEVGIDQAGPYCKKHYASTYYQWVKNGDFAVQYGAVDRPGGTGTADRSFHRPGAHALLKSKFGKLDALNQRWIDYAKKHGYVETLPDRTVDPARGVPIECTRTDYGKILPTVPLNYHVQSTACWWMLKAMIQVQSQLDEWRRGPGHFDAHIVLQVHDELVVKMPVSRIHPKEDVHPDRPDRCKLFRRSNLWRARVIQRLMAAGGDDLVPRVNTSVSCHYHDISYAEGMTL
jgi:hypothetical protein